LGQTISGAASVTDHPHRKNLASFCLPSFTVALTTGFVILSAFSAFAQTPPAATNAAQGQPAAGQPATTPAPASTPAPPVEHCDTAHLSLCEDTNQLIWSKGFADNVGAYIGTGTANWLFKNGSKIDQMIDALSGPPQVRQKIGEDIWLYGACRERDCSEKGAIVLSSDGSIKAAALLHFSCGDRCKDDYTLTILGSDDKALSDGIENWAKTTLADDAKVHKLANPPKIATVEHIGTGGAGDKKAPQSTSTTPPAPSQTPAPKK
jgi:hypothetical protein